MTFARCCMCLHTHIYVYILLCVFDPPCHRTSSWTHLLWAGCFSLTQRDCGPQAFLLRSHTLGRRRDVLGGTRSWGSTLPAFTPPGGWSEPFCVLLCSAAPRPLIMPLVIAGIVTDGRHIRQVTSGEHAHARHCSHLAGLQMKGNF